MTEKKIPVKIKEQDKVTVKQQNEKTAGIKIKNNSKTPISTKEEKKIAIKIKDISYIIVNEDEIYRGQTTVTPKVNTDQTLTTANKIVQSDITVKKIPGASIQNQYGTTFIIGE